MSNILNASVEEIDSELFAIVRDEQRRQATSLEMIASENFTSLSVLECLGSCLHNKYSEGLPGARYYGGNEFIDKIELLAQKRALEAFNLNADEWGVNVQPYSGSPANFAVYTGLLQPHSRIMGLDLPDGGHLTHGFMTSNKKVSATSIFFESMPYKVDTNTGLIDYDNLEASAKLFKPKLIIAGVSCYSRCLDYARFRKVCNDCGAYLLADMSHVAGLVASGLIPSPFDYADVVSTTTHKTLRGPRAGVIFFRKSLETAINNAVFPGLQGGPHNNTIAAIATAFHQVKTVAFKHYQIQVIANARRLCSGLMQRGYNIATGGTDVHLLLIDLRNFGVNGSKAEYVLEKVNIACNRNTVPGDKSAMNPSGIRLGTPAVTTRGLVESDIDVVVEFIDEALKICVEANKMTSVVGTKLFLFKETVQKNSYIQSKILKLRNDVALFSVKFPLPGFVKI